MFTHSQTLIEINANLNESVSHATFRPQDLIPAFLEVLKNTPEYEQLMINNTIPSYVLEDDDADWWDSDECAYLVNEELPDVLNMYAPKGYYFGSNIGDGSDFGFWELEEEY